MSVETPHILYRKKAKSFLKKRLVSKQIVRLNTQFGILSTKYKAIWTQVCTRVVYPSISETAFDRVEHTVLLCKLSHYGKRGIMNNWFDSYLNDSLQTSQIGASIYSKGKILLGVPQGSIIGPLFSYSILMTFTLFLQNSISIYLPMIQIYQKYVYRGTSRGSGGKAHKNGRDARSGDTVEPRQYGRQWAQKIWPH